MFVKMISLVVCLCLWAPNMFAEIKIASRTVMCATDPNRNANWNWTNNVKYDLYYRGENGVIRQPNVSLPYFATEGPAAEALNHVDRDY